MYNNDSIVSFEKPDRESYFVVTLNDGKEIYEDDRPGQSHAWERVKYFLASNKGMYISGIRLERNGVKFEMPNNQKGYFFGQKLKAIYPNGGQQNLVGVGYYDGLNVMVKWFTVPGFKTSYPEIRSKEQAGFFLIINDD